MTLPDAAARARIVEDLDRSLLVEAGAGSGKTTALVARMVALLGTGRAEVHRMAAVTFTRKAAAELRERFQNGLEAALVEARATGDAATVERLDAALRGIERAFLGTIHAFCARLLRERPIAARLDPGFRELIGPEADEHRLRFWHRWLEERHAAGDPSLVDLAALGMAPAELFEGFTRLDDNRDAVFAAEPVERPDGDPVRAELSALLDRALAMLPRAEPPAGWDVLQKIVRRLRWLRGTEDWEDDPAFFDELAPLVGFEATKITQNRWADEAAGKKRAKELAQAFEAFGAAGGLAENTLARWYAHRYPAAIALSRAAADAYAEERHRTGRLTFQDLLLHAARLLRESPSARRELGERYRWLLVDEFQDTDPVQAEVVFLLAAADPDETDWRRTVPRPGALFVVGDPKQSIYRFRRADISIYQAARRRFEAWGDDGAVLELVANFRSRPAIEAFVDEEFAARFPAEPTDEQARFAPLVVQKPSDGSDRVACYCVEDADHWKYNEVAREDAARVAAWIRARLDAGERRPGDFLILPYNRRYLTLYAAALEERNVPVQVTGAEITIEHELRELKLLLSALVDPENPALVVAVLVGLFFGLDHEQLAAHALDGGRFRFTGAPPDAATGPVPEALDALRRWWRLARAVPADVAVGTILEELGLLPYAAASSLGGPRAGAIGYMQEVIREIGLQGDTSLAGAIDALDAALELGEAEAPLEPGREDVVRVMNLHRAKGTEATVVVLAAPTGWQEYAPSIRIERAAGGAPRGWVEIGAQGRSRNSRKVIARPLEWRRHQAEEARFEAAERDRLLYVAATRAKDELIVSRCRDARGDARSFWSPLLACIDRAGTPLALEAAPTPERFRMEWSAAEVVAEVEAVARERLARKAPSYETAAVSALAKEGAGEAMARGSGGRGAAWGSAVHQALAAALRGLEGEELRLACRNALLAEERPVDRDGEPRELGELVALVEAMRGSEILARAGAAEQLLVEVPFALRREQGGRLRLVEGVIDLAFREADGWVIADYKTDVVEDAVVLEARRAAYERQVELYAECWRELTGETVKETRLVFTSSVR